MQSNIMVLSCHSLVIVLSKVLVNFRVSPTISVLLFKKCHGLFDNFVLECTLCNNIQLVRKKLFMIILIQYQYFRQVTDCLLILNWSAQNIKQLCKKTIIKFKEYFDGLI